MTNLQIAIIDASTTKRKFEWGEVVEDFKFFACHPGQLDVLAAVESYKFIAAFAGAQGGKTSLIPLVIFKRMAAHKHSEPFRALFVSPSVPMRDQSQIIEHMKRTFAGTALQGKYNKSDRVYKFPTGAEVLFRTADDPVKLDAGVYDFVVIDEAAKKEYTPDCWSRLKVRASSRNAPILAVSTPDLACCIYDEFVKETNEVTEGVRASKDGKYLMRVWASNQRPGFNLEAYEDAKKTMSAAQFSRMYQGVFAHFEGLVYEVFGDPNSEKYPVIEAADRLLSPAICTVGGGDFGFAKDPNAFLIAAECEDGIIYVLDEHYKTEENNDQLAVSLRNLKSKWEVDENFKFADILRTSSTRWWCDTEDPKTIKSLQGYGINAAGKRVKDIVPSVAIVSAMFRAGRLKIMSNCKNLIGELKRYKWNQQRNGDYDEKPRGKDDHLCDALRYLVGSHMMDRKITPVELDAIPDEERDRISMEAAVRLGQTTGDAKDLEWKREKAWIAAKEEWFNHFVNIGTED